MQDKSHMQLSLLIKPATYLSGVVGLFLKSLLTLCAWGPVSDFSQEAPEFLNQYILVLVMALNMEIFISIMALNYLCVCVCVCVVGTFKIHFPNKFWMSE